MAERQFSSFERTGLVGFKINPADQRACMTQKQLTKTEKRRQREMKTLSQMIALYCAGNHSDRTRNTQAYCKEAVCDQCAQLDTYAVERTKYCKQMETKTSCDECPYHCYKPQMREQVREVMRYSGPRMITRHPIAAVRHLIGK